MKDETPTPIIGDRQAKLGPIQEPTIIADRYKVLNCLGEGGMGKVYESLDTILDRKVAIKVMAHLYDSDDKLKRFQQEAKLASKLNHPGIVTSYDFGVSQSSDAYFVMECVSGKNLSCYLEENGPLSQANFISLFGQLTDALSHAHSFNVIHRDIKPSNIMVREDGKSLNGFVLDFGIAKGLADSQVLEETKTGQMIGSPRCISPEQIQARDVDARADIYSLGCVMYESLSGSPPYVADSALETMKLHLLEDVPSLKLADVSLYSDEFILKVEEIIQRALQKDPEQRFQSMAEVCKEIRSLVSFSSEREEHSDPSELVCEEEKTKPNNRSFWIVSAIAISTLIAAFFLWGIFQPEESKSSKNIVSTRREYKSIEGDYDIVDSIVSKRLKKTKRQIEDFRNCSVAELSKKDVWDFQYSEISDKDLMRIHNCPLLRSLNLSHTKITNRGLAEVLKLRNLEVLHLTRTSKVMYTQNIDWSRLQRLRTLSLDWNDLDDNSLEALSKLPRLQKLKLNNNPRITNKGLRTLSQLPLVRELDLSDTGITQAGLTFVKGRGMTVKVNGIDSFANLSEVKLSKKYGIQVKLDGSVVPEIFAGYESR